MPARSEDHNKKQWRGRDTQRALRHSRGLENCGQVPAQLTPRSVPPPGGAHRPRFPGRPTTILKARHEKIVIDHLTRHESASCEVPTRFQLLPRRRRREESHTKEVHHV